MLNDDAPVSSQAILSVINSLPVPTFLIQASSGHSPIFKSLNQAASDGFKKSTEQIVGKTAEQVFDGASGVVFAQKLEQLARDRLPLSFNISVQHPHYASQFLISMTLSDEINSDSSGQCNMLATAIDMTDTQSALSESMQMALLVSEIESFMAQSADELQAPIEHLSVLSQELNANFKDLGDGKLQLLDKVEELSNKTLSMVSLVSKVICRSRAINPLEEVWQRYDFKDLCVSMFELFDPLGHHELVVDRTWIKGEAAAMRVVMSTIFENSLRHNLPENVRLCVSIDQSANGDMLHITTIDNGRGFDDPATVFLPVKNSRSGPGLSLPRLRKWIRDHGGVVTVTAPAEGSGAIIAFSLPGTFAS